MYRPCSFLASPGCSKPDRRHVAVLELRLIEEIRQRRAEIGFERHAAIRDFDRLPVERVVQLEHEVGCGRIA